MAVVLCVYWLLLVHPFLMVMSVRLLVMKLTLPCVGAWMQNRSRLAVD